METFDAIALAMRKRAFQHRERKRIGRAVELEQLAAFVERAAAIAAMPITPPCPPPLMRKPFATACHELADRARVVRDNNPGLRLEERAGLLDLELTAHYLGDNASCAPDLYTEPQS